MEVNHSTVQCSNVQGSSALWKSTTLQYWNQVPCGDLPLYSPVHRCLGPRIGKFWTLSFSMVMWRNVTVKGLGFPSQTSPALITPGGTSRDLAAKEGMCAWTTSTHSGHAWCYRVWHATEWEYCDKLYISYPPLPPAMCLNKTSLWNNYVCILCVQCTRNQCEISVRKINNRS